MKHRNGREGGEYPIERRFWPTETARPGESLMEWNDRLDSYQGPDPREKA